jgi:hypothetical protein
MKICLSALILFVAVTSFSHIKWQPQLSLQQLVELRRKSETRINKTLQQKGWINTTKEDIEDEHLMKDEHSWKIRKARGERPEAEIVYTKEDDAILYKLQGPVISYITYKRSDFTTLVEQARNDLKKCSGKHEKGTYHFIRDKENIMLHIAGDNNEWSETAYTVTIGGAELKQDESKK